MAAASWTELDDLELSMLRKVAGVMAECAAELPIESEIGTELANSASRLLVVKDREPHLKLVRLSVDRVADEIRRRR